MFSYVQKGKNESIPLIEEKGITWLMYNILDTSLLWGCASNRALKSAVEAVFFKQEGYLCTL